MSNDPKKIQEEAEAKYLSVSSIGRPYGVHEIPEIFEDMKKGLKKALPENAFAQAIEKLGTHAPKIISPRADKIYGMNFRIPRKNAPSKTWVSGNGALGSHAKVLCRPIAIIGEPGNESFIERIMSGCKHAPALENAFANAFGQAALNHVKAAVSKGPTSSAGIALHGENFPIFYLPGPDGTDIQASPGGYVDAYVAINSLRRETRATSNAWWDFEKERQKAIKADITNDMDKDEAEKQHPQKPRPPQVSWIVTAVSDKMQNAVIGVEKQRSRLFVKFPEVLDQEDADLWRYVNNGAFPPLRNPELPEILVRYAHTFHLWDKMDFKPDALTAKIDNLADAAIRRAIWHIDDIKEDISRDYQHLSETFEPPEIFSLLAQVNVRAAARILDLDVDGKTVAGALRSKHFASRLKLKGHVE
jgi:hypothetical protein